MKLNKEAYSLNPDSLIYDNSHPIDGTVVKVKVPAATAGVLVKGQILDYSNEEYEIHKTSGKPSVVVVKDTEYAAEDTEIEVEVYTSGTLCFEKMICDPELTADDCETLRSKGIWLK